MKNKLQKKKKIVAFIFLLSVDCSVLLFGEVAGEKISLIKPKRGKDPH